MDESELFYLEELLVADASVEDLFDEDFLVGVLVLQGQGRERLRP